MVRRYNRLLVALYVITDALLAMWAFVLAYGIRFESGLIPVTKGYPPLEHYLNILPFVAILTPLAFHLQGIYRLRRGRSRVDDFFAVLVGSILAVVFGIVSTLYVQAYYVSEASRAAGTYQVSRAVWALFLVLNVLFTYMSREAVRELLEHRWRAGVGLKRVLIAGAGDLGRMVADRILQHRELGYQVVGFVDDRAGGDHIGYRGLALLGTLAEVAEIAQRERIDHLYVALPLDEHAKLLDLMELTSREFIDVKVVPDLLQFIALRARLEDLDGLPVINVNEVPLQGVNAWIKRSIDVVASVIALIVLAIPFAIIAALVRWTSAGPVFYRQERMGLDGRAFTVFKFRSMREDAEESTGPVWARDNDPRTTAVGRWLRRLDLDELPQLWNVLKGEMSIVGPRPERPFFVEQFKYRIPQYMLRHKVKAGITGWAQVNGWRGNTSLEKRIEYDLYYIENWSVTLDLKIMWLTVVRRVFQRDVAYQDAPSHMARVVVTGAAGFIGSHLSETLLDRGDSVVGIDNLRTGDMANIAHLRDRRFEFIRHDVTRYIDVEGEVDAVLHFASPASPIDYLELPIQTLKVGSLGTHNALGLAKAKSARFLLASTSEVYGDPLEHPQKETYWGNVNPIGPRGVYDEAKRFAEAITLAYHRYHGLDTKIVRIFNTYGPRMRLRDGRAVPAFMSQALRGEDVTVFGDGTQTRSFCFVTDLVAGILKLLASNTNEPVNIGNPHELTIEEIARAIIKLVGSSSKIVYRDLPVDDPKQRKPDITRARTLLGWEPKVGLEEGLLKTVDYFKGKVAG